MIKKYIISSILSFVFCMPAFAYSSQNDIANRLKSVAGISAYDLEDVLKTYVFVGDEEAMVTTFKMYWNPKNGEISFDNLLQVCIAGGITECQQNPSNPKCDKDTYSTGDDQCMTFIRNLIGTAKQRTRSSKDGSDIKFTERSCKKAGGTWAKDILDSGYHCVGKDGKLLKFSSACGNGYGTCVRDFADINVQEISGFALAQLWGEKHGLSLTCKPGYENRSDAVGTDLSRNITNKTIGQDYIRCSADGNAYEFEFDDLTESMDNDNYYGIAAGICALYHEKTGSLTAYGECLTTDHEKCAEIDKAAQRFGFNTSTTGNSYSYCAFNPRIWGNVEPRTAFGINPQAFESYINLSFSSETKNMVREYVLVRLNEQNVTLESFECDAGYINYGDNDNLWTCYVNGEAIDFIFDDLSESSAQSQKSSISRMACETLGGVGTSENCHGLDVQQCIVLGQKLKERGLRGTHYDHELGGCLIEEAEYERARNLVAEVLIGVVITIVTAGTGSAAYVAVAVGGSVATDLAFEAVYDWQRSLPYEDYREFIKSVLACSTNTTGNLSDAVRISQVSTSDNKNCLAKTLGENYELVVGQMTLLAPEDQDILTQTLTNIANVLGDEEFLKQATESEISFFKSSRNYAGSVLLAGTLLFNPEKMVTKFDNIIINSAPELGTMLRRFGKTPVLEPAYANSLGRDFYRITINNGDDVGQIINALQGNGWYISATTATDGQKFLVASQENIFGKWSNSSSNWLNNGARAGANATDATISGNYKRIKNANLERFLSYGDRPIELGKIRGQTVFVDTKDFGQISGRPIVMVSIRDRKIPFYISTGTAGKITVPTGKWEFFGGISPQSGWFNKGTLDDINRHYDVPEFRQIADWLDSKIGDLRNVQYIQETATRSSKGGVGFVGVIENVRQIDMGTVNQSLAYTPGTIQKPTWRQNVADLRNWFGSF